MRRKITVVGGGSHVAEIARRVVGRDGTECHIVDAPGGLVADLLAAAPLAGFEPAVTDGGWDDAAGSHVVVLTAATEQAALETGRRCPDGVVVVTSEHPADCARVLGATGFPRQRVIGVGGVIATAQLRSALAAALRVSVRDVHALVLGAAGGSGVPVLAPTLVGARVDEVVASIAQGPTPGAFATAEAVGEIVDAIALDLRRVLPCAALCQGEYGIDNLFAAVPVRLGAGGIERIVGVDLEPAQRDALAQAAAAS